MNEQQVIFTNDICSALSQFAVEINHDRLFMLFDSETMIHCMPLLTPFMNKYDEMHPTTHLHTIVIGHTDVAKNIESLTEVWKALSDNSSFIGFSPPTDFPCCVVSLACLAFFLGGYKSAPQ